MVYNNPDYSDRMNHVLIAYHIGQYLNEQHVLTDYFSQKGNRSLLYQQFRTVIQQTTLFEHEFFEVVKNGFFSSGYDDKCAICQKKVLPEYLSNQGKVVCKKHHSQFWQGNGLPKG